METESPQRQVHYTLEPADAKVYAGHLYRTVPKRKYFVLRQSLILPVAGFIALWINNVPMHIAIPIILLLGLSSYFLIMLYLIWWTVRRLCEVRGWLGNHFLALEPDRIEAKSQGVEASVQWGLVDRIVVTNQYIYLFLDFDRAFVIPKRAFASEQEAQQFLTIAQSYWRNAAPEKMA